MPALPNAHPAAARFELKLHTLLLTQPRGFDKRL